MSLDYCNSVSERYIELYENITGSKFEKEDVHDVIKRVKNNIYSYLKI